MSALSYAVPIRKLIDEAGIPADFITASDGALAPLLDRIFFTNYALVNRLDGTGLLINLVVAGEAALGVPGLESLALVFGSTSAGATLIDASFFVGNNGFSARVDNVTVALRFPPSILKPVPESPGATAPPYAQIEVHGAISVDENFDLGFEGFNALSLKPVMIGNSGIVISAQDVKLDFSRTTTLPEIAAAGFDESFMGVYIGAADVVLPPGLPALAPADLKLKHCVIGSGGVSGLLDAHYTPSFASGQFTGPGAGELFGIPFGLKDVTIEFKQNALIQAKITGEVLLPFFDEPVDVELGIDLDGNISVKLTATGANGLKKITKPGVLSMELDSLGFELKDGLFSAKLSGKITPLIGGINWPSFDVRDLSIDSKGHLHLDGGWIPLPKSYAIDFHGAKLEITQFGMGQTDDGGKYVGMSGSVKLVEGLPAGASVEGLRITWYGDSRPPKLTLNGIGISFKTPAVQFDGHVSYSQNGNEHRFTGDLKLVIPAADNLTLIGKAVFGKDAAGTKYFAIYVEGDFGTGIPLWVTGLYLYGFAGLLAINYAPKKPADMAWYSIDKSKSWFHKPDIGVIDIVKKWQPEAGTFAIGAGVTIGTGPDAGFDFNGKFLLLILCPGPVLMIDGSARFLGKRDDTSEPPFHGLIVLDNRAGYFLVGLDARWKSDKSQGTVADISGSMEAFFNYHDPTQWHLRLGKDTPMAQRIQARIAKVFTANAYFMLDAKQLKVGAWIGQSQHYNWGPVKAGMEAWLAVDAAINFKPPQLHVAIQLHGYLGVQVFRFKLGVGLDAILSADVFKPFHILGELDFTIATKIKKFHIHMRLEWGPHIDTTDLTTPDLLPVLNYGIAHPKSSIEWPLSGPAALPAPPLVPVDCRPYVTFNYPIHDAIGVGVNPAPDPGWMIIGDPDRGVGSARAHYRLTKIELYRDGSLVAACPQPSSSVGKIFGSWAPSVPGTSGGQNKLLLGSMNPLDFADKTDSWNPWLSSNLPGYPCPDKSLETDCVDFQKRDLGLQLYGAWWDPQKLDFRFNWSDAGPHPIVAVSPAVQGFDRGLFFPAAPVHKRYRAYVSNFGDSTVSLVDLVTNKVIATIAAGLHPRQVVLSPDGKRAYVCNQDDNTVIAIDTATNLRVGTPIAVIKSPVSIVITQDGKRAFVPSGVDPAMSAIDLPSLKVTTVKLTAVANQAVLSPDGKKLYVMHGPAGSISIFAPDSLAAIKTLAAPEGPAAMVFHPSAPRAWISFPSHGTVRLFDTGSDQLAAPETPTGTFVRDLALSPDGSRLYAGNLQGNTVSVLDTGTLGVLATIATPSPAGLRMTPDGAALLVANYFANTITVIDPIHNQVVAQGIAAGQGSNSFALLEAPPQMLYQALVAQQTGNTVAVLDLQTGKSLASIPVGHYPVWIALSPDGKRAYVCNQNDNTVTAIDTVTNATVGAPIPVATRPESIAIAPDGKRAFVMSALESKLSVIDLTLSKVTASITTPGPGNCVLLSADGQKGYAICGAVAIFSPSTLEVTKVVSAPNGPQYMTLHPSLPRAFVSFPSAGSVQEFDLNTEQFTGTAVQTGTWAQNLCLSPDGSRLYVCNLNGNTISVIDIATNKVTATIPNIPGPKTPVFTSDGSMLVVASYTGSTVTLIDPVTNHVLGNPVPCPSFPNSLVLQGTVKQQGALPLVPVDVTVDVPAGSSSVEVTWSGKGPLRGTVSNPSVQMAEVVAAAGSALKMDVTTLGAGLANQGINQIRLRSDSEWTLIRVCVTRLPFAGGLAEQQRLNAVFNQQVAVWQNPTVLLDPGRNYELHVNWSAEVQGMGDLNGWSDSFSNQAVLNFQTVLPPSLGWVSDPRVPQPADRPAATGLEDLSLYVRGTIPVTQVSKDEVPELTKPVFCGYDVAVDFNESYVDQMYQMAGRDLDLLLFDRNNQLVRDANGPLIIVEDAWANAPTLELTDTQALWIDMFNANTCKLQAIDPKLIPTSKILRANDAHVLAADTVYEARLVPQLMHQLAISGAGWTTETSAAGAQIWHPPSGPAWTDYRASVLVTLKTSDPVGILFRYTNGSYYEFTINPGANRRQLTQVGGATTTLAEDYYVYHPGTDDPYRIHIEAVGSQLLISQNGTVVFGVTDAALPTGTVVPTGTVLLPKGAVLPGGTVGLRQPVGQNVFQDFGVSDLSIPYVDPVTNVVVAGAPVAYSFRFTTSEFANFYHQIHSFQDEIWAQDLTVPLDLSAAAASSAGGVLPSATPAQPVKDNEIRAYDRLASLALGSAAAQNPPQMEVTRLGHGNVVLGWLLLGPEPIDYTRTEITLSTANRALARAVTPGAVKNTETVLGDAESVTVLVRQATDLSGYCVQYRQMPSALADERGNQDLWKGGTGIVGDQTWSDYRASVVCSSAQPGGIGLQFRYVDAQNYYAFTYDCVSGLQQIIKMVGGTAAVLKSVPGDPAPGLPNAPPVMLAVSVQGSQIAGYRARQKVVEASDTAFPLGGAGVFSSGNPSAQFESFEVHRLPIELYALFQGQFATTAVTTWVSSTDGSGLKLSAFGNSSWTDVVLRARVRRTSGGTTGLLLRYQDAKNHYRLLFTNTGQRLDRVVQGVATALWSALSPLPVDRTCEIAVSAIGNALSVFQDSVLACEAVDQSFASGSLGLCALPGADLAISQLIVYPPELTFSNWTLRDEFQEFAADSWNLVDAGDQGGPSNWQVTNGRLTQTSAIHDSSPDPIRLRGTIALLKGSSSTGIRLVTRLLSQQPGAIGAVFGYQDADNFYRLSMDSGAGYRRLVSCINGNMMLLWADSTPFDLGHDYVLTLDLIDDYVTAWLDGERVFQWRLSADVGGALGLYCCGNPGASFGDIRVGTPAWIPYYTFGPELIQPAGNRVMIASAKGGTAPNRRTAMRVAADLDDPIFDRLPPNGAHLRVLAADQTVQHGRECIPAAEFAEVPFQALRKADGTGILIAPVSSITAGQAVRLSFRYHRDNGIVAFSEVGETGDELVFIDLPTT